MKCPHCGTEWTIQKITSQTVFCPGCGKPYRTAPEKQEKMDTLEDCLRYLCQKFGEETLHSGKQLIGYHSDLMPNRERDRKLLRMLVSCDGQIALMEAKKKPAGEQSVAIARLAKKMQDNMFAPDPVREVCSAFWLAIGGHREALKSILPQPAPAPSAPPVQPKQPPAPAKPTPAPNPAPKPAPQTIPPNAVYCPSDYEISGGVLKKYKGRDAIIRIPAGIRTIGFMAFHFHSSLRSITLPDGLQTIDVCAFSQCSSLVSITLPDGLRTIESGAFYFCSSLKSITVPDSVREIDEYAFRNCSGITVIASDAWKKAHPDLLRRIEFPPQNS